MSRQGRFWLHGVAWIDSPGLEALMLGTGYRILGRRLRPEKKGPGPVHCLLYQPVCKWLVAFLPALNLVFCRSIDW